METEYFPASRFVKLYTPEGLDTVSLDSLVVALTILICAPATAPPGESERLPTSEPCSACAAAGWGSIAASKMNAATNVYDLRINISSPFSNVCDYIRGSSIESMLNAFD